MVSPPIKPEEISQWLNIPTLHMHYKHNWDEPVTQVNHVEALREYFIFDDLSISYNVLFAEAKFLGRIFPNIPADNIINLLREIGNEPNRIRVVARKLCFLKNNRSTNTIHTKLVPHNPELRLIYKRAFEQRKGLENDSVVKKSKFDCNENIENNTVAANEFALKKLAEIAESTASKIEQEKEKPLTAQNTIEKGILQKQEGPLLQQGPNLFSLEKEPKDSITLCSPQDLSNIHISSLNILPSKSNTSNSNQGMKHSQPTYPQQQIETVTSTTMLNEQKIENSPIGENLSTISKSKSVQHPLFSETNQATSNLLNEKLFQKQTTFLIMNNFTQHRNTLDSKEILDIPTSSTFQTENKNVPFAIVPSTSKENFVPSFNRNPEKNVTFNSLHPQHLLDNITKKSYSNFPTSTTSKNMEWLSEFNDLVLKFNRGNETDIAFKEPSRNSEDTFNIIGLIPAESKGNVRISMNTEKQDVDVPQKNVPIDLTRDVEEEDVQLQPSTEETETNCLAYQLMEIFPEACPDYLKRVCKKRGIEPSTIDNLISEILSSDYPRRKTVEEEPKEFDVNELSEHLKEILPNADPTYLQMKAELLANKPEELKIFISNAFENHEYPTMKDYLRRVKLSSQQKQYTSDFTVENFLEVIPDPFAYFKDPSRKSSIKDKNQDLHYVIAFLKNKYPQVPVKIISSIDMFKFNLIKVCQLLDKTLPMKSKRKQVPLPELLENIPLLQEIAFILHEEEIRSFIKLREAKEQQERENAKQAGILETCQCCFDEEVMPKDFAHCNKGCVFCKSCVSKSIEVAFGDGKLQFSCLSSCTSEFSLQTLQSVLNPKIFSTIALKKQVEEVKAAGIEDIESCPFCDFVTIPAREDKLFRCLNPDCMKESCRQCKEPSHVPLRCDEVEKDEDVKARTYIENKMTEALIRKCYKCGMKFVKSDGCNKMTCSCGASMCYICNKPVANYKHFNGQGGTNFDLCPLYSDTEKLHVENVLKSANEAKAELGKETLKIDPTTDIKKHYKIKRNKKSIYVPPNVDPFAVMNNEERLLQEQALNFFLRNENINVERFAELNRIRTVHRQHHHHHHNQHRHHQHRYN